MKISVFKTFSSICVVHNHRSHISLEYIVYCVVESHPLFLIELYVLKNGGMSTLISENCEVLCSIPHHTMISTFPFLYCFRKSCCFTPNHFLSSVCHVIAVSVDESTLRTLLAFSNLHYLTLSSCETLTIIL